MRELLESASHALGVDEFVLGGVLRSLCAPLLDGHLARCADSVRRGNRENHGWTQRGQAATEVAQTSKSAVSSFPNPPTARRRTPRRFGNRRYSRFGNLRYNQALPRRKICAACEN